MVTGWLLLMIRSWWAQVLYALALVPVGLLADRVHRPRLLAAGITVWSLLTMAASRVLLPSPPSAHCICMFASAAHRSHHCHGKHLLQTEHSHVTPDALTC